jgi:DNA-binding MarR family transcriptional regulator
VDDALDNTELELFLSQLLRLVGPASGAEQAPGPGGASRNGHGPGPLPGRDGAAGLAAETQPVPIHPDDGGAALPALSASEARALIELIAARGIAQGELGQLLGLEKSTVSRLAAGLERKGWLRRGRDEGNQRYVRLYLTPEGRAIAERVWRAWQSRQARILAELSADERAGLAAGLRGLVRGLTAEGLLGSAPGEPSHRAGTPTRRPPGS